MEKEHLKFAILISTKNRIHELLITLDKISLLLSRQDVECVVFDDGSTDGTFEIINSQFPNIILHRNSVSKGYLFCRNAMLNDTRALYAISLDDDAHFLIENPFEIIESTFFDHPNCGLLAFRIFWGKELPISMESKDIPERVNGFVGCGHVWRMETWKLISDYPEWFVFYGEEEFASFQLFKINKEIIYVPDILVNHRVDIVSRRNNNDYQFRLRRSLSSGWFMYFLFYPLRLIPQKISYTLWIQLKNKSFKGDILASKAIFQAIFDVLINLPKLYQNRNRFSNHEFKKFQEIPATKIFWKPEEN